MTRTIHLSADYLGELGTFALAGMRAGTKAKRKKAFRELERLLRIGQVLSVEDILVSLGDGTDNNGDAILLLEVMPKFKEVNS